MGNLIPKPSKSSKFIGWQWTVKNSMLPSWRCFRIRRTEIFGSLSNFNAIDYFQWLNRLEFSTRISRLNVAIWSDGSNRDSPLESLKDFKLNWRRINLFAQLTCAPNWLVDGVQSFRTRKLQRRIFVRLMVPMFSIHWKRQYLEPRYGKILTKILKNIQKYQQASNFKGQNRICQTPKKTFTSLLFKADGSKVYGDFRKALKFTEIKFSVLVESP